jgi:hypothetical protein
MGMAGVIAAAGAVMGYGLPRLPFSRARTPRAYRIDGPSLVVLDGDGRELWRYTFQSGLIETAYRGAAYSESCIFEDIDGDGLVEILFLQRIQGSRLYCFDTTGRIRWEFDPGRTVVDNLGRSFAQPFWPNSFRTVARQAQSCHVIVSSNHNWSFPDQVAVLDGKTGKLLSEYWHRGHLLRMATADLDEDGEPEILLGGVNDAPEYKRATVVIFDHRRISGASKNPNGGVYFQGMSPGTEKKVIFFPRTNINKNLEFNQVESLTVESGRIKVCVVENTGDEGPYVVYEFDYQLRPINVLLSNTLSERYRELQAAGQLPAESFDLITERLKAGIQIL